METTDIVKPKGYTCTGCGEHTDYSYCDVRLGALCKKCRDEWDSYCEPEIKILRIKKEEPKYILTKESNFFKLLKDYRDRFKLPTEIDKDCQDVADRYIREKQYSGENEGIVWLNSEFENEKWHNQEISIIWLQYDQRRYNNFIDLFSRTEVKDMLKSRKPRFGYADDFTCSFMILAQRANLRNPYQTSQNSSYLQ